MSTTHSRRGIVPVLLALAALTAIVLLPSPASAEVSGLTAAPASVAPGGTSVLVVDADEGAGTLTISASVGTLTVNGGAAAASCAAGAVACTGVGGGGTSTVSIPDAGNDLDVVVLTYTAPATGPASATVTATQGTARTVTISVVGTPELTPPIPPFPRGGFLSGSIPSNGGFGLVVFGGGSYEDLVRASGCPGDSVSYWATDAEGRFLLFLPAAPPPVSADFAQAFPGAFVPSLTALIGKCNAVSSASGIQGRVTIWPPQPVCFVAQPCPEQPYSATLVILNSAGNEAARVTSSPVDGRYRAELTAGSYTVVPTVPDSGLPTAQPVRVEVPANTFVTVDIQYDSGIRY